jgi:cation transport ATPase
VTPISLSQHTVLESPKTWKQRGLPNTWIAGFTGIAILSHLALRVLAQEQFSEIPLYAAVFLGGAPLLWGLARRLMRLEFGSDLLAGLSIVTSTLTGQLLAGAIIVLMLSGGSALELYATRRAKSVLAALRKRTPTVAHQRTPTGLVDIPLDQVGVGDTLVILPHELAPVDGTVIEGHGQMDESYLTGEPLEISKTPGSTVLSGAVNGQVALVMVGVEAAGRFAPRLNRGAS